MIVDTMLWIIGAYIVGSIPSGYLIARFCGINDIRHHGSGNIGATNVGRLLGAHFFFITFFCDCLKSYCYMRFCESYHVDNKIIVFSAMALVLGNMFSCFLRGIGGKGVSTSYGIFFVLFDRFIIAEIFLIHLIAMSITRTMGIGSVLSFALLPVIAYYHLHMQSDFIYIVFLMLFISMSVIIRHKENIQRFVCSHYSR